MRGAGSWLPACAILASACGARSGLEPGVDGQSTLAGGASEVAGSTSTGGASGSAGAPQTRAGAGAVAGASATAVKATAIAAGTDTTCALKDDGTVWCWGSNSEGQLGDGTTVASSVPVRVLGVDNAVAISAGGTWNSGGQGAANSSFNCAVLRNGSVQCWGSYPGNTRAPVRAFVPRIRAALGVAGGNGHACALMLGGMIECWGRNQYGQLGNASTGDSNEPVTVVGIRDALDVVGLGSNFTCAHLKAGTVECWGELGLNHIGAALGSTPVPIPLGGLPAMRIAAGYDKACAVLVDGQLQCWGDGPPETVPGISAGIAVAVGKSHICALLSDGTLRCWGENQFGQLGARTDGLATVSQIHDAIAVSAGYNYSCALSNSGAAWCWGMNLAGQLGDGEDLTVEHKEPHYDPVRVVGL